MPVATIVPKYVNPPAVGKKEGSLKLADGSFYGIPPAMLSQFQVDGTYSVEYKERTWQGKTFRSISAINSSAAPSSPPSTGKYGQTDDATAERIFCCGALNAFITAGKIEPSAANVVQAVKALRVAWAETLGKKPTRSEDEMSDSIPF